MSYRTPPPPPGPPPRRVSVALILNVLGLALLVCGVGAVLVAAYRFDPRLALAIVGAGAGYLGWRLTTVTDEG